MNLNLQNYLFFQLLLFYFTKRKYEGKKIKNKKIIESKSKNENIEFLLKVKKNNFYKYSSFFYGIAGLFLFKFKLPMHRTNHPIKKLYKYNLLGQSFLSYKADVQYLEKDSIYKYLDRNFAIYNIFLLLYVIYKLNFDKYKYKFFFTLLVFKYGRRFKKKRNVELYVFYHFLWHLLMPSITMIETYKIY